MPTWSGVLLRYELSLRFWSQLLGEMPTDGGLPVADRAGIAVLLPSLAPANQRFDVPTVAVPKGHLKKNKRELSPVSLQASEASADKQPDPQALAQGCSVYRK